MDISAVVITLNEENNLPRLINSLKDCEEIIIADGGSTDNTIKLAEESGAKVFKRDDHWDIPTKEDIYDFIEEFGYRPKFTTETKIPNMAVVRNKYLVYAKNDWVFYPDADEIVTWDTGEIEELMKTADKIDCPLIQSRDDKGNPTSQNNIGKLFKKSKYSWFGRSHEVIAGNGNVVQANKMKIDHYRDLTCSYTVDFSLEYAVLKEKDSRSMFYLGREYYYNKEYDKSIKMLDRYLKVAWWHPEIAEAHYFKALSYWSTGKGTEAREAIFEALKLNPDMKKALILLSEFHFEPWKSKWSFIAQNATNKDVLFP